MNNSLIDINGQKVRTIVKDGKPWFVLEDVCRMLGLADASAVVDNLEADEKAIIQQADERAKLNLGRQEEVDIISESGLYAVIFCADTPEAKPFCRWVTHEVLPRIRKNGVF